MIEFLPPLFAIVLFLGGIVLVIESVEIFVESVARSATALGVSGFLLTVILAGTDLENAVLGVAAIAGNLPDLALGTVFGEALFVLGAAVGLAGLVAPFETTVPRNHLLLFLTSPLLFLVLSIDGALSRIDGAILTFTFLPLLAIVVVLELNSNTQYLSTEEAEEILEKAESEKAESELPDPDERGETEPEDDQRTGWYQLGVSIVAVVGMTVGSELAVEGARGLLSVLGISGLAFGATVMSFIASLEELFLTVTPARQGRAHLSVGNIVGSVLFFVTANIGVIALVRPINLRDTVFTLHWPFFVVGVILIAAVLYRGRVKRLEGGLLLGLYAAYWVANYL